jgi:O-antigen/teichoic acid export membrane protein
MLGTLLSQISTNVANLITARFVSLEALGLYNRAQTVSNLFSRLLFDAVNPILLPLFSNVRRENADIRRTFLGILDFAAVTTWPFMCFLSICSEPIIVVMFGDQWADASNLLRLVAIGGLFWIIPSVANPVLVAVGRAKDVLHIQLVNQTIAIIGVTVAAMQGIEAVALAVIPISAAHACIWLYFTRAIVNFSAGHIFRALRKSAAISLVTLAAPGLVIIFGGSLSSFEQLVFSSAGAGVSWAVAAFTLRHPIRTEVSRVALYAKQTANRWIGAQ